MEKLFVFGSKKLNQTSLVKGVRIRRAKRHNFLKAVNAWVMGIAMQV